MAPEEILRIDAEPDLGSLRPEQASEYVLAYLTAWKRLQKEIGILQEQILLWEGRVKAARERAEPQLAASTHSRVERLKAEAEKLQAEEEELGRRVALLKRRLKSSRARQGQSVDAQALLAQLQGLLGEPAEGSAPAGAAGRALREQEAQAALEELKRKMQR